MPLRLVWTGVKEFRLWRTWPRGPSIILCWKITPFEHALLKPAVKYPSARGSLVIEYCLETLWKATITAISLCVDYDKVAIIGFSFKKLHASKSQICQRIKVLPIKPLSHEFHQHLACSQTHQSFSKISN